MTCDEPLGRGRACAAKPSGSGRSPGCDDSVGLDVGDRPNTLESFHPASLLTWRSGIAAAVLTVVG